MLISVPCSIKTLTSHEIGILHPGRRKRNAIIDMLNYKNVRILYPLKFGISLDLCHADGLVSKALFHAGMAVLTIMVLFLLYRMYFH